MDINNAPVGPENENGDSNDFKEYRRLIISELKRLSLAIEVLDKGQRAIDRKVVALVVKSGIWGLIGSSIPILVVLAIMYIRKNIGAE